MADTPGLTIESLGDGWYLVSDEARRWHVAVASTDSEHWVFVDGLVTRVAINREEGARKRPKGSNEGGVTAPMPATVVAIHAAPGQTVQPGDTLIVLEAMKMELPIRSPRAGVIKSLHCNKGDLVQPGVTLLEFE